MLCCPLENQLFPPGYFALVLEQRFVDSTKLQLANPPKMFHLQESAGDLLGANISIC